MDVRKNYHISLDIVKIIKYQGESNGYGWILMKGGRDN